jgi:hypothetical protein
MQFSLHKAMIGQAAHDYLVEALPTIEARTAGIQLWVDSFELRFVTTANPLILSAMVSEAEDLVDAVSEPLDEMNEYLLSQVIFSEEYEALAGR